MKLLSRLTKQSGLSHLVHHFGFETPLLPGLRACAGARQREAISSGELSLGRLGNLEVRLARSAADVRRAQALRYQVFFKEMHGISNAAKIITQRDVDSYDAVSDHLLVFDCASRESRGNPLLVGTYRLLRQTFAQRIGGFYNADWFDIDSLIERHSKFEFLELGRACVLPDYRNKRVIELLWHGILTYVQRHGLYAMIGGSSLEGIDPRAHAIPLSFLHHYGRAPEEWRVRPRPQYYVEMNLMRRECIDCKTAINLLPPLVKGYLRVGAFFSDGAIIDPQFGSIVVLVVLPFSSIKNRYIRYFLSEGRW